MQEILESVAQSLPSLLRDREGWNSLKVDYNHPHVDRLWRQVDGEHRVLLHKIYPCETEQSLLHPHPWPSVIRIIGSSALQTGHYEVGFGWGDPTGDPPPIAAKVTMQRDGCYEMTDPRAWHYVRPIDKPVYSLMIIGKPFATPKQDRFGQLREHRHLSQEERNHLFDYWTAWFGF